MQWCVYIYEACARVLYLACSRIGWECFLRIFNKTIMYQAYICNSWYCLWQSLVESNRRWKKTCTCIGIPIFSRITLITDQIEITHATENVRFCDVHWFDLVRDPSMLRKLVLCEWKNTAKFSGMSSSALCPIKYVFHVSQQSFMTCGESVKKKEI